MKVSRRNEPAWFRQVSWSINGAHSSATQRKVECRRKKDIKLRNWRKCRKTMEESDYWSGYADNLVGTGCRNWNFNTGNRYLRSSNRCGGQGAWNGSLTLRWNSACPTEAGPQSRSKKQNTSKLVQTMTILCFCLEDIKYLKYNPTPVINRWKEDIEQQCTMAICIHLIKMKVVPKYPHFSF